MDHDGRWVRGPEKFAYGTKRTDSIAAVRSANGPTKAELGRRERSQIKSPCVARRERRTQSEET